VKELEAAEAAQWEPILERTLPAPYSLYGSDTNCCRADLSSHQFVSEPYRLKVLGCVRSRIDSHWAGSAACNSFTNIGSAIGLKCRSDIQRNFDSLGGALACAGLGFYQSGRAAAVLAARVLLGEDPRHIPIEEVAVKKLVLNKQVARKLGVTFSPALLQEAS